MGRKKKNIVKLLSLLIAFVMAVGGVLTVSAKDESEETGGEKRSVAYLDLQNGSDKNDGLTAETPLKTVEAVLQFFAEPEDTESTESKDSEQGKTTEEKTEKEAEEKESEKIDKSGETESSKTEETDGKETETITKPEKIVVLCGEGELADEEKKELETAAISMMTTEEYEIYLVKIEEEAHPSPVPTPTAAPDPDISDGAETDPVPTVTPTVTPTLTPTPEATMTPAPTEVPDGEGDPEQDQSVGTYRLKSQIEQPETPDENEEQKTEPEMQLTASTGGGNPLAAAVVSENAVIVNQPESQILRKLPGKDLVGNGTQAAVSGNGSAGGKTQNTGNYSLTPQRPQGSGPVYTGDLVKMYPFIISLCMSAILCGAMFRMMLEDKRNRSRAGYRAELEQFREDCKIQ